MIERQKRFQGINPIGRSILLDAKSNQTQKLLLKTQLKGPQQTRGNLAHKTVDKKQEEMNFYEFVIDRYSR